MISDPSSSKHSQIVVAVVAARRILEYTQVYSVMSSMPFYRLFLSQSHHTMSNSSMIQDVLGFGTD